MAVSEEIREWIENVTNIVGELKISQHDSDSLTRCYGFLKFDESNVETTIRDPQYIRLSLDTSAETVVRFMQNGWRLPTPDLIISVTGGAKNCDMSARLRKVFQRGLVAAAVTTNAWIITAGTNAGVVKEVGEALNQYRYKNRKHALHVPCIGIGSWGYTAGNEQLTDQGTADVRNKDRSRYTRSFMRSNKSQTVHSIVMDVGQMNCIRTYIVRERPEKRCELEPNHTHFLLFDDGQYKADTVLEIRGQIEKLSRNINKEGARQDTNQTPIPIVMVLVEGGPSSIKTIIKALEAQTPVVVVKDSGRAADLVAEVHSCLTENDSTNTNPSRPQTSYGRSGTKTAEIAAIFDKAQKDGTEWAKDVKDILCNALHQYKQLITVFKFDSKRHNGNLEDAILESLFNATKVTSSTDEKYRRATELKLAMAWNRFDYAQKHLLTDKTISKWDEEDLRRSLIDALYRGHVDFVELLIEFGASLEKLTYDDLDGLYNMSFKANRLPIKGKRKNEIPKRNDFHQDYFHWAPGYKANKNQEIIGTNQLNKLASRELFLWAIFLNRFELATYLCSKTWNSSVAPLIGAFIYRRASRIVINSDEKDEYEENAKKFDHHSMLIIDQCFANEDRFAVDLLKRPVTTFYDVYPLQIAQKSNCKSFLASKCVQMYLDNEWFGAINYKRKAINFRVFLCSLFFPLIPIFCLLLPYVDKRMKLNRNSMDIARNNQTKDNEEYARLPKTKRNNISPVKRISYFYAAPIVRFYYYTIFFVIFLALYSYVLLVDYFPLNTNNGRRSGYDNIYLPVTEILLHICIWSLIVEELRQFFVSDSKREYISEVWNSLDLVSISFYLVGFVTRFFVYAPVFVVSKIFLCLDLIAWFVRTLHLFAAYERLGPKLVMIFNTMKDLLFFVCFIFIFLLGFSVASWALITTDDQVTWDYSQSSFPMNYTLTNNGSGLWSWGLLYNVTNYGIWKIFGQVDLFSGSDAYTMTAFVLAILFLAIANVLLLNVLVALFNVTIQNVANQSHQIWRYQRFLIVFEYCDKPPLPPPFNMLYYVYNIIRYSKDKIMEYRTIRRNVNSETSSSPISSRLDILEELKITDAMQRENAIADDYWRNVSRHAKQDDVESALQNIERRILEIKERIFVPTNQNQAHESQIFVSGN